MAGVGRQGYYSGQQYTGGGVGLELGYDVKRRKFGMAQRGGQWRAISDGEIRSIRPWPFRVIRIICLALKCLKLEGGRLMLIKMLLL